MMTKQPFKYSTAKWPKQRLPNLNVYQIFKLIINNNFNRSREKNVNCLNDLQFEKWINSNRSNRVTEYLS